MVQIPQNNGKNGLGSVSPPKCSGKGPGNVLEKGFENNICAGRSALPMVICFWVPFVPVVISLHVWRRPSAAPFVNISTFWGNLVGVSVRDAAISLQRPSRHTNGCPVQHDGENEFLQGPRPELRNTAKVLRTFLGCRYKRGAAVDLCLNLG